LSEQAANRLKSPASSGTQKLTDILKLWDVVLRKINLFLKFSDGPVEFIASISFKHAK